MEVFWSFLVVIGILWIMSKFGALANERVLLESDTIKTILVKLRDDVIPLFET